MRSAGFSVPKTFLSSSSWRPCFSCINRALKLMWRSLLAPLRLAMVRAAVESAYTTPLQSAPQSRKTLRDPSSTAENFTKAISSASAELRVTQFYVLAYPLMNCNPTMIAPRPVDLPVTRQPAQSESLHP